MQESSDFNHGFMQMNPAPAAPDPQGWRRNHFLADVPPPLLEHLAGLLVASQHAPGTAILTEGDASDRICLLAAGRVGVFKGGDAARLGTLEAGAYFGEMGMLSGAARSTSVIADTEVVVWSLTQDALQRFQQASGVDLLQLSLKAHAGVLGERLARTNDIAAQWLRERMEQYRIRVSFGMLFTNVILMMFLYTSALGMLRQFSSTGDSSTLTTSALLLLTACGAAWIMKASGFAVATFGFTLARWRWVVADTLAWSIAFCLALTVAKAALLHTVSGYAHLQLFNPWVSAAGTGATLLAYALYVALSPVQEFVARGMMQGSLTKMLTGRLVPLRSILVANAIFSISHQHLGLGYALAVFVPGLFWGWLYHRHGSLLGVSISHVLIGLWGTGVLDLTSLVGP